MRRQFATLTAWALLLNCCSVQPVCAAIRVNLLTRLNQIVDDPSGDRVMSAANKVIVLNQVGREYGRRGLIVKRDTITTANNVETYALNSDFAGGIQSAYVKTGQIRKGLLVVDRDSAFRASKVEEGVITYCFVDEDGRLGLHSIPRAAQMIVVLYFAHAAALAGDSTEWDIPDAYEDAALYDAAERILGKLPTSDAQLRSRRAGQFSDSLLSELLNPVTISRKTGVTDR